MNTQQTNQFVCSLLRASPPRGRAAAGPGVFSAAHNASAAHSSTQRAARAGGPQPRRSSRRGSPEETDELETLRRVYLDMHLAFEAGQGAPWAALDSSGAPFPDPLNVVSFSVKCALFPLAAPVLVRLAQLNAFLLACCLPVPFRLAPGYLLPCVSSAGPAVQVGDAVRCGARSQPRPGRHRCARLATRRLAHAAKHTRRPPPALTARGHRVAVVRRR